MNKQIEALKLALESLEAVGHEYICQATHHKKKDRHGGFDDCPNAERHQKAITAIREALAEQPAQGCEFCSHPLYAGTKCKHCGREQPAQQQQPYGHVTVVRRPGCVDQHWFYRWPEPPYLDNAAECHTVYTSPPASKPWVGLTSEDKVEILRANGEAAVLILTEAKLREKNAQPSKPLTDEQQIAEALRRHGLTLVKTATGYDVLKLGQITANGIKGDA